MTEGVEHALLSSEASLGRPCGLALQYEMHVLVLAVLLRAGWFDELRRDPESNEPDRELREAAKRVGRKGSAVVGANALRYSVLPKELYEDRAPAVVGDIETALTGQVDAREIVLHRCRTA